jgi:hypothetical protein
VKPAPARPLVFGFGRWIEQTRRGSVPTRNLTDASVHAHAVADTSVAPASPPGLRRVMRPVHHPTREYGLPRDLTRPMHHPTREYGLPRDLTRSMHHPTREAASGAI